MTNTLSEQSFMYNDLGELFGNDCQALAVEQIPIQRWDSPASLVRALSLIKFRPAAKGRKDMFQSHLQLISDGSQGTPNCRAYVWLICSSPGRRLSSPCRYSYTKARLGNRLAAVALKSCNRCMRDHSASRQLHCLRNEKVSLGPLRMVSGRLTYLLTLRSLHSVICIKKQRILDKALHVYCVIF